MRAVEAFVDKRHHRNQTAYTDPKLPNDHIEEFVAAWEENCERAWYDAYISFGNRALGEYQAQAFKEMEDEETEFYKIVAQAEKEVAQKHKREKREARTAFWDDIKLTDRDRNIRVQTQKEGERQEDRKERKEQNERRENDRQEDRIERKRLEAKREAWQDETREWRIEDRVRQEDERKEKTKREKFEGIYEQAQLDHELHVYSEQRTAQPFTFPDDATRMAGTWILGNSGKGKTVLMHNLVFRDAVHSDAAILCIDNKYDFVAPLKTWAHIQDRLVLIEPNNDFLLALNPLDIPRANINHVVELIDHLLSSLVESSLSGAQTLFFRNVVPALYDIFPHPTFADLINVIQNGLTHDQLVTLYDRCDE
jgi:hypothetical protein